MNSERVYDVDFHTLGLRFRVLGETAELTQYLSVVAKNEVRWDVASLLKSSNPTACPIASISRVVVQHADETKTIFNLNETPFDMKLQWDASNEKKHSNPPVSIRRFTSGSGKQSGGLVVELTNISPNSIRMNYFDSIPWYLQLYLHTFRFDYSSTSDSSVWNDSPIVWMDMDPAEDRGRPSTIEMLLELKAFSTFRFTIDFDRAFLHWKEFPPDPNRGFDVGSARVSLYIGNAPPLSGLDWSDAIYSNAVKEPVVMYSDGSMIHLPTPDFSMPYNAITLAGTILAVFFGVLFNVLMRRSSVAAVKKASASSDFVSDRPIARLIRYLVEMLDFEDEE